MCHRHSFILTRAGKIHDGLGLTDSHTTIRELAGLGANDSTTYAFEWQPPEGWPDADYSTGLTQDTSPIPVWDIKTKHTTAIESHIRRKYPDMAAWNQPDEISNVVSAMTSITGDLIIPKGATFDAPALAEVSGCVDVREDATFAAPVLAEVSGSVYVGEGATFAAPVLTEVSGYVDVHKGATFAALVVS